MVVTVASRNHYATLGLTPRATAGEIAQAFAREMSALRIRPVGGITQVCIAYETLRNPTKRRAYDQSLGLDPKPAPLKQFPTIAGQWRIAAGPVTEPADHIEAPAADTPPPTEPDSSSLAVLHLAHPAPEPSFSEARSVPVAGMEEMPRTQPVREPSFSAARSSPVSGAKEVQPAEAVPIEWKRTAATGGALVAAVAFLGAWAGLESVNDPVAEQVEETATVRVPPARAAETPAATESQSPQSPVRDADDELDERRTASVPAPAVPETPVRETAVAAGRPTDWTKVEVAQPDAPADGAVVADPAPVDTVEASMPLSNRVIARTIERIGYACGQVASTSAVAGGGAGVFRINCTSGQSYQASPVNGRYRFRRWGRD